MSDTEADKTETKPSHKKRLESYDTLMRVIARGAQQDLIAHGDLDRLWLISDMLRQSKVLGFELGFTAAKTYVEELGLVGNAASPLPTEEEWIEITSGTLVKRLRDELQEMQNKLDEDLKKLRPLSWLAPLLSGKLEFPYEKAAPMRPEVFAGLVEAVRLTLAGRRSQRKTRAEAHKLDLDQHHNTLTLKADRDINKIDEVETKIRNFAGGDCRKALYSAIDAAVTAETPTDWTNASAWKQIILTAKFVAWYETLKGGFGAAVIEDGTRGQKSAFEMPEAKFWLLNDVAWDPPPRLAISGEETGKLCATVGGGAGAVLGAATSSYQSGAALWAAANWFGLFKVVGGGALVGGVAGAALAGGIWLMVTTRVSKVASNYSDNIKTTVAKQIEEAAIKDFVERFAAYYDEVTEIDDLKAQHALDHHMLHAVNRLVAANTTAYYEAAQAQERGRPDLKLVG
nr:hypothetical protein [Methylobacterium sp. L1A1]